MLCAALGIPENYGSARGLILQREALNTVEIAPTWNGRTVALHPEAAEAWQRMVRVAGDDHTSLFALSGFRSYDRQAELIRQRLAEGRSIEDILKTTAAPGYSEHHTGFAVDVAAEGCEQLTETFENTPAFRWLMARASEFGFALSYPRGNTKGIIFEPWHWCYWK